MRIKEVALKALAVPVATAPFAPLIQDRATIFMLHRFRDLDRDVEGTEPAVLDEALAYLRRRRYELVGLEELLRRMAGDGPPLRRAVAFTIDDGYLEQATIAAPIFSRYDCPVTTFVTTGFLDRTIWLWWDQIEYVLLTTRRPEVSARVDGVEVRYSWEDEAGRRRAAREFNLWCTRQPEALKRALIAAVARSAEVEVPVEPPRRYLPMTWDHVRACERLGMTFGPHTVTHPILSRTPEEQSRDEMAESWSRLRAEASRPLAVFAYPNGTRDDFGPREVAVLEAMAFLGAVIGTCNYADARAVQRDARERFSVPRFGFPEDLPHFIQYVSGVERLKQLIRRWEAA